MANSTINSSLNLVALDFDSLKGSFITYLQSQEIFKDYDFTGSNLNVLIDLMTYNTLKNVFFLNMNVAESFLDSAQLRDSVLSHAKSLNYTPRSARSAKAKVQVTFTASGDNQPYIIQKGQSFSTLVKNDSYMFSIPETIILSSIDTNFTFETEIYEGIYLKDTYIFQSDTETQRFRLSNLNVDTDSMTVTVYEDNSLTGDKYFLATSLLDLDYNSKVYFLQASEKGYYEIIFGDNITGRQPKINSTIVIDYRISKADLPNGARKFALNFDPTGPNSELLTTPEIITIDNALGGDAPESNESVRYYAPRHFQVQERTVIPTDYEIALKEEYPEINAVSAYGGEDANPPQYGFVFIAVDIKNVDGFPDSKKSEYYNFIRKRSALTPVFVDPLFTYFGINSTVRYNVNLTTSSKNNIKTLIINQISEYNEDNLDEFGVTLRYSQFINDIDNADSSIVSNITDVRLYKKLNPSLGVLEDHVLEFGMPLKDEAPAEGIKYGLSDAHSVSSDVFRYNGIDVLLEDDNDGNIRLVRLIDQTHNVLFNIGTVDYSTGKVTLSQLKVDNYSGDSLKIFVTPKDRDITIPKNTIGAIELNQINVTVEALSI